MTRRRGGTLLIPIPDRVTGSFVHFAGAAPLAHCLRSMLEPSHVFDHVVVAAAERHVVDAQSVLAANGLRAVRLITAGGQGTRADCLLAGVDAYPDSEYVVIHDVSRALASWTVRDRVLAALHAGHDVVIPALVMVDSVKSVDRRGSVERTVDRTLLRSSQFPRGLRTHTLREALATADPNPFDEVEYALRTGGSITTVDGDPDGFEMHTPRDTSLAEAIVSCRLAGRR